MLSKVEVEIEIEIEGLFSSDWSRLNYARSGMDANARLPKHLNFRRVDSRSIVNSIIRIDKNGTLNHGNRVCFSA